MTDGIGTTAYGYNPVNGQLGSGRLASVTNPLPNSVVTYNYDALGRTTNRAINGVAQTVALDGLGRVTIITNALGTFTNTYVGTTMLIATNFYPNGQKMVFGYHSVTNDQRLAEIWNQNYNGSTLSKFDYEYTPDGQIKTWTQQSDADTPTVQVMQYDPVNELLNATIHSGSEMGAILKQFMYGYDQAGNHTSTSMGTTAGISMTSADYNNANQMTSMTGGSGMMRFAGVLDKAGTVSVSGNTATMNSHSNFVGYASVTSGTNIIPIIASDYSSHSRTNNYQVVITNLVSSQTLQYDLNGNMTNDGAGITYEYNAADRTVAINRGANRTEFAYDGFGRRVQIVEKTNGVSVITNKYVWCETDLCEQRDNTGGTAVKRFFEQGEQISGTNYYFTSDYLGSIREVTDSGGAIRCRYDYDPYGVRTKTQGNMDADFGFTGHFMIASQPETTITLYRLYRTDLGRWLSRDPLGETVGLNVYAYVLNNPVNTIDPDGRCGPCIFAVAVLALGGLAVLGAYSAYNAWYKTDTIASAGNAAVTMENTGQYAVARDYRNQVIQNDIWGSGGAAKDISGAANGIVDFPTRFADIIPAVTAALLGLSSGSTPNSSQSPVNPNQPQPIFGLGSGYGDTHNMPGYITPRGGFYNGPTPPAGSKKNCP
jgi:RHS repeat-associated protein